MQESRQWLQMYGEADWKRCREIGGFMALQWKLMKSLEAIAVIVRSCDVSDGWRDFLSLDFSASWGADFSAQEKLRGGSLIA